MIGILSPVMTKVVEEEESYPSPSAKTKINKAIGRYKLLSKAQKWKEHMDDIRFALADLLVARGEEDDYREALSHYDRIIAKTDNQMLKGRSMIGKAELAISGVAKLTEDEAMDLCKKGCALLRGKPDDFFVAKGISVEAELLVKKGGRKEVGTAAKLFGKLIGNKKAHPYFRARALAGKAELALYFGADSPSNGIKMCEECLEIFLDRPLDYFAVKARVIEAELLVRRGSSSDLHKAEDLCRKVIISPVHKDLAARAKLVLAEISKKDKAQRLFDEVLEQDGLDPYLIEKAKIVERAAKNRFN
jgi:hypothetical protein